MEQALTETNRPVPERAGRSRRARAGHIAAEFVALTKPRIVELLLVTTVPAMILAARRWPSGWLVAFTVAGGAMTAGGANALNMVYDRDIDALMQRTRGRPLVTGSVSPSAATAFALALEGGGFVLLWQAANLLAAVLALSAAAFYVGVYTIGLKRWTSQNIVIGGAAGAAPVLVGWAAVTGQLSSSAWVLFAIIFLWTPPHFWALAARYREDYSRASVPMLPAVKDLRSCANQILTYSVVLLLATVGLAPVGHLGPLYLATALVAGSLFIARSIEFRRQPTSERAMRLFRYSILYLSLIFVAVGLDGVTHFP